MPAAENQLFYGTLVGYTVADKKTNKKKNSITCGKMEKCAHNVFYVYVSCHRVVTLK